MFLTDRYFSQSLFMLLAGFTLVFILATSAVADSSVEVSVGYDYTTGKYDQGVTTKIENVPVTIKYTKGAWRTKLTIPYIRVTGNGTVVPGSGGPVVFNNFASGFLRSSSDVSTTTTVTNSGLGDIIASAGYTITPAYEVTVKVKFGTADESKGLGTGENDYFLQFDGVFGSGKVTPFFTLGYLITGDSAQFTLKDVPYGTLGLMFKYSSSSTVGLGYDYRQATVSGVDDKRQFIVFIKTKHSKKWSSTFSALAGFTDSSPDYGIGYMLGRSY